MLSLWQMGVSTSAVILLAALLRRLAGTRLPRRMYVALWDIAMLSGLIPFRVTWDTLIGRIIGSAQSIRETVSGAAMQTAALSTLVLEDAPVAMTPGTAVPAARGLQTGLTQTAETVRETMRAAPSWLWQLISVIWGVGALVLAAVLLYRWLSCRHAFAEALPCEDPRASSFLRTRSLRRRVRIRVSDRIRSPLSYGLLRPVILLPASLADADDQTLGYVLTHEFMHIRAWDMLRKSALLLTLCLHWPNPLFWLMVRLCNRDLELMCDERVVRSLGGRKAYCLTLLDMEVKRSNLTMGTCFSVTGIEERINVMKNRKHQGILSIALAFAILLGAAAGAMTGIPLAGAETPSPRIFFSRSTWENSYAQYEPYGLGYDATNGTVTYKGQVVRYFEDMWPIDEQGKAGTCFQYADGTIDVYGVREFPEYIRRNPDGSFDPSGILIGLREATKEEYDEQTLRMQTSHLSATAVTEIKDAYQVADVMVVSGSDVPFSTGFQSDLVWWTADEYRAWMEEQREAIQELVDTGARAWTKQDGWFTWTPEKMEEAMALYEDTLAQIEQGAAISKPIYGSEDGMLMQNLGDVLFSSGETAIMFAKAEDALSVERLPEGALGEGTVIYSVLSGDELEALKQGEDPGLGNEAEKGSPLFVVSPAAAQSFPPEILAEILEKREQNAAIPPDDMPTITQTPMTATDIQAARMEGWYETIAPYAAFGLTCALDTAADTVRLYWNGREIRGVFDAQRKVWITEHTGMSAYSDGAKEIIAVYENGVLTGLREADAEESAVWDSLRKENMK